MTETGFLIFMGILLLLVVIVVVVVAVSYIHLTLPTTVLV